MLYNERSMKEATKQNLSVFLFYSSEVGLLQSVAAKCLAALQGEDTELTSLEGPAPDVEEVVAAAGTISFFGTRRLVELPMLKAGSYSDKDVDDLCDILASTDNAVFVITCPVTEEWGKLRLSKKEKKLFESCEKIGYCAQLAKPRPSDLVKEMQQRAKAMGTELDSKTATAMVDRCGEDLLLLRNETDKLAALSGYTTITQEMVSKMGTQNLDADVFEMINMLTSGKLMGALDKLKTLIRLQNEPIAIVGALSSNYVDLYRLSCGMKVKQDYKQVYKDFKYKGSDYRLSKATATAQRIGKKQLRECIFILEETDGKLKSSPMDGEILLQAAMCRLAKAGSKG